MISAPRTPPKPCPPDCTKPCCTDPLARWAAQLNAPRHADDSWTAVDLQRPPKHRTEPTDHLPDFARFDADFAELHRRIGGTS